MFGDDTDENQFCELLEAFSIIDKDHNGVISSQELGGVLSSIGQFLTPEERDTMMYEASTGIVKDEKSSVETNNENSNEKIDFPEFASFIIRSVESKFGLETDAKSSLFAQSFKAFADPSKNVITAESLKRELRNLNEIFDDEFIDQLIKEASIDENGHISPEGELNFSSFLLNYIKYK